jgi:hypothetical protein
MELFIIASCRICIDVRWAILDDVPDAQVREEGE